MASLLSIDIPVPSEKCRLTTASRSSQTTNGRVDDALGCKDFDRLKSDICYQLQGHGLLYGVHRRTVGITRLRHVDHFLQLCLGKFVNALALLPVPILHGVNLLACGQRERKD